MKTAIKLLSLAVLVSLVSGCATILSGTSRTVNLMPSDGENVKVKVTTSRTMQNATLPTAIPFSVKSGDIVVSVTDPCYKSTQYVINRKFNFVFLVNIITGGLFGSTTDLLSGAIWTYDSTAVIPTYANDKCAEPAAMVPAVAPVQAAPAAPAAAPAPAAPATK